MPRKTVVHTLAILMEEIMFNKKGNSTSHRWTCRLAMALLLLSLLLLSPGVAIADQSTLFLDGYAWSDACFQNNGYAWSDWCFQTYGYAWSD